MCKPNTSAACHAPKSSNTPLPAPSSPQFFTPPRTTQPGKKAHTTKDASAYIHEIYYHVCQREDCQAKYNGTDATTVKLESAVDGSLKDIMFVVETGKVRGVVTVAETEEGIVVHGV